MNCALLIFIKNPERGKVKTRLAKTMGDDAALQIYCKLLQRTRTIAEAINVNRLLFYSSYIERDEWDEVLFRKYVQQGNNLGERMAHAFKLAFERYQRVVIIGSDCPELTPELIGQAFDMLTTTDVVLGPAEDGGYYLLGMRSWFPQIFENKAWSTSNLLNDTLRELEHYGQSYQLLPKLSDIDYEKDWRRYGW